MRSVFLLGGSGFVGRRLAARLEKSCRVFVFGRRIDADFFSGHPDIVCRAIDLAEEKIPGEYGCPDFVVNLASVVTAGRDLSLFGRLVTSNLTVLLNQFERFRDDARLKLFMQFGSIEEYGSSCPPFREDSRENPNSPYGLVKQLTTNTAMMLHRNYGFPACVVRPANLFGKGQAGDKFIPYILGRLRRNEPLDVSPCGQRREFMHVDDLADRVAALLENYGRCVGEIINVGPGQSVELREVIEFFRRELNSASEINYGALPYRENEAMDLRSNVDKLSGILRGQDDLFASFRKMLG